MVKQKQQQKSTGQPLTINELETWLWDAACSIRGAVDAPKFKDYILPLIFVKRLSDVFDDEVEQLAVKFEDAKTALELVEDDHSLVRFYIPHQASWSEIRKLTGDIGQKLTEIIRLIAKSNPALQGVIDIVDFNATVSAQRIIEDGRLSSLVEILSRHRLGLKDVEPDILGRAYEYLLRKFAEGQGQTAGEFFTPKEVGWLIARLLRPEEGMDVYDPACGSAGLLVKAQLTVRLSAESVKRPLRLFGQELNHVTFAIAKMNMIIHDMEGQIAIGDTLRNPKFLENSKLQTFDLVAANPMWNQDGYNEAFYDADSYGRFVHGYPPASTADWGWLQHMLASLNEDGRAVIVLDTGALSRGSGGEASHKERDIRKAFIEEDLIEGVILLPLNLFYNTSSQGILLCLNRKKSAQRKDKVVMVNAADEFIKGRPKNYLPEDSIDRIATAFLGEEDIPHLRRTITIDDVRKADYNISPSRHVGRHGEALLATDEAFSTFDAVELQGRESNSDLHRSLAMVSGIKGAAQSDEELHETEVGLIPKSWKVIRLRDAADSPKHAVDPREFPNEVFEYYSIPAYQESQQPVLERGVNILSQKLLVHDGVVLFGKLNPRVPKVWLVSEDSARRKIASTEFIPLEPKAGVILSEYLYYLCWSEHVLTASKTLVSGSTPSRQRVEPKAFLDLPIPLPSLEEQAAIAGVLRAVDTARGAAYSQGRALDDIAVGLLSQLITGRARAVGRKGSSG